MLGKSLTPCLLYLFQFLFQNLKTLYENVAIMQPLPTKLQLNSN
jgi:hypothetical protein